jgi:hypothetical protein
MKNKFLCIINVTLILFLVSCSGKELAATPKKPFKGYSNKEKIVNKGYTLFYRVPKDFKPGEKSETKKNYEYDDCEFVIMLIPYAKNIPRWAYYNDRKNYQKYRMRKGISKTFSGNRTLGGLKNTYYYLVEVRINKKDNKKLYLTFFERYIDNIGGSKNVLVKVVLRSENKEKMHENLNRAAFIFRTFNVKFLSEAAE